MQDNSYNQNNQVSNGVPVNNTPVNPNVYSPNPAPTPMQGPVVTPTPVQTPQQMQTPNQAYYQYQVPPQMNNAYMGPQNAPTNKKKTGPLLIFGLVFLVAITLVITLFFSNNSEESSDSDCIIKDNMKTLVVYFSHAGENYRRYTKKDDLVVLNEGNTSIMAKKIAGMINADLFEIVPATPYPETFKELFDLSLAEKNNDDYPEIKNKIDNLNDYDVIYIGYPIWHTYFPQIIKTFLRDNKEILKKKIVVPFNTHAGGGSTGTYDKLYDYIGTAKNYRLDGLPVNGADVDKSDQSIKNWLKGLCYKLD